MKHTAETLLAARFPNASAETRRLNAPRTKCRCGRDFAAHSIAELADCGADKKEVVDVRKKQHLRKLTGPALNGTEQRWQDGHPLHRPFPMALRWGKSMSYKPDFMEISCQPGVHHRLIEVKGGHIYDRDIVRFKGCAAEWIWLFEFQLWQWKNGVWTRLY